MNKLLCFLVFLLPLFCNAEVTIKGYITDKNSGKPMEGVIINSPHAGLSETNSLGEFELEFFKQDIGDIVSIRFLKPGYDIVDFLGYENFTIPNDKSIIKVEMCSTVTLSDCRRDFIENSLSEQAYLDFQSKIKQANTRGERLKIKVELDSALAKIDMLAKELASLDPKEHSAAYLKAANFLAQGKTNKAIASIPRDEELEDMVSNEKNRHKGIMRQYAYYWQMKALIKSSQSSIDTALIYFSKSYNTDSTNFGIVYSYASFLHNTYTFNKAEVLYEKCITLAQTDIDYVDVYFNLGRLLSYSFRDSSALESFKKSLVFCDNLVRKDSSYLYDKVSAQKAVGNMYVKMQDPRMAIVYYDEALKTSKLLFNKDSSYYDLLSETYGYIGNLHHNLAQYSEALKNYELAFNILDKRPSYDSIYTVPYVKQFQSALADLAMINMALNKNSEALSFSERSYNISKLLYDHEPLDNLMSYFKGIQIHGSCLLHANYYDDANKLFKEAIELIDKLPKEDPRYLNNIISIFDNWVAHYKIDYDFEQIIKIVHETENKISFYKKLSNLEYLDDLEGLYYVLGYYNRMAQHYNKAVESFQLTLKIRKKIFEKNQNFQRVKIASVLTSLGAIYPDYQDSTSISIKIEDITKGNLNELLIDGSQYPFIPYVTLTENDLGISYLNKKNYEQAMTYLREALSLVETMSEREPDANLDSRARILNDIGAIKFAFNDHKTAESVYHEALEIRKNLLDTSSLANFADYATSLKNLGIFYITNNQYVKGITYLTKGIMVYQILSRQNKRAYRLEIARGSMILGLAYYKKNRLEAIKLLSSAKELAMASLKAPLAKKIIQDVDEILANCTENELNISLLPDESIQIAQSYWFKADSLAAFTSNINLAKNYYHQAIESYQMLINRQDNAWYFYQNSYIYEDLNKIETNLDELIKNQKIIVQSRLYAYKEFYTNQEVKKALLKSYRNLIFLYLITEEFTKAQDTANNMLLIDDKDVQSNVLSIVSNLYAGDWKLVKRHYKKMQHKKGIDNSIRITLSLIQKNNIQAVNEKHLQKMSNILTPKE